MARFFERISEALLRWLDSLSARERRLLGILFACVAALLVVSVVFLATNSISSSREQLQRSKKQLAQIKELEGEYVLARERNESARRQVATNNVSLFTFIQSVATRLSLTVSDLTEQTKPIPKSQIVEVSVRLNLSKLSIDRVTAFIEELENSEQGELVKVTRLKISKRFDEPDLLDLQMTVSTWKSA